MSKYTPSHIVNDQDHEQVVFRGKPSSHPKSEEYKAHSRTQVTKREKELDQSTDAIAPPQPLIETRMIIQKARLALKMSQKDLAAQLNMKPALINEWESGKSQPTGPIKGKLERILKVKIPISK